MGCQRASRLRAAHPIFLSRIPHSRRLTSVRPQARFLPLLDGGVPMDNLLEVPGVGQEALVLLRSAVPKDLRVGLMTMGGANGLRRHVFSRHGFSARAGLAGSQTPAFAIFTLLRSVRPESSPKSSSITKHLFIRNGVGDIFFRCDWSLRPPCSHPGRHFQLFRTG